MAISKLEYWFLDFAATSSQPLECLTFNPDQFQKKFKRPFHGLTVTQLVNILNNLVQNGEILLSRYNKKHGGLGSYYPFRKEIDLILRGKITTDGFNYFLTTKGGTHWEELSKPNWELFLHHGWGGGFGIIEGSNRNNIEKYFSDYNNSNTNEIVIAGSEYWKIREPLQITYWKTITKGHELWYHNEDDYDFMLDPEIIDFRRTVSQSLLSQSNWYTPYYRFD